MEITEQNPENDNVSEFLNSIISTIGEFMVYLWVTFITLSIAYVFDFPCVIAALPLNAYFIKRLACLIKELKSSSLTIAEKKSAAVSLLENLSLSISITLCVFYVFFKFSFFFVPIPVSLQMLISCYIKKNTEENYKVIKIFQGTLKFGLLLTLFSIGLKIESIIDTSWNSAFWPLWILLSLLVFLSLSQFIFLLATICTGQVPSIISIAWLTYSISSFTIISIYFLQTLSDELEGYSRNLLIPTGLFILNIPAYLILTKLSKKYIEVWMGYMIESEDWSNLSPSQRNVYISRLVPRYFAKISPTYYKPVESPVTRNYRKNLTVRETKEKIDCPITSASVQELNSPEVSFDVASNPCSNQCMVCFERESKAMIMDCGHGGLCFHCAINLKETNGCCHICRKDIVNVLEIKQEGDTLVEVSPKPITLHQSIKFSQ